MWLSVPETCRGLYVPSTLLGLAFFLATPSAAPAQIDYLGLLPPPNTLPAYPCSRTGVEYLSGEKTIERSPRVVLESGEIVDYDDHFKRPLELAARNYYTASIGEFETDDEFSARLGRLADAYERTQRSLVGKSFYAFFKLEGLTFERGNLRFTCSFGDLVAPSVHRYARRGLPADECPSRRAPMWLQIAKQENTEYNRLYEADPGDLRGDEEPTPYLCSATNCRHGLHSHAQWSDYVAYVYQARDLREAREINETVIPFLALMVAYRFVASCTGPVGRVNLNSYPGNFRERNRVDGGMGFDEYMYAVIERIAILDYNSERVLAHWGK